MATRRRWSASSTAATRAARRTCSGSRSATQRPGRLEIVRYDSTTAHALGAATGPTRVVWQLAGTLPTVQCVEIRRTGNALTGPGVTLLSLSAPIGREASC